MSKYNLQLDSAADSLECFATVVGPVGLVVDPADLAVDLVGLAVDLVDPVGVCMNADGLN